MRLMGRTREFDRDAVLWAAANLFRRLGYRNVSIGDLAEVTGLVSGSIYNAFGDKAGLFRAALKHYVDNFVMQRLGLFAGEAARLEELERLYQSIFEPPLSDGGGCLVTNSIIEFGTGDDPSNGQLAVVLDLVRDGIAGVARRELPEAEVAGATMRLVILYHGILALSRSATPLSDMSAAIKSEFDHLKRLRAAR